MATKKNPEDALMNELMDEIENAQPSRPKGKFLADGRYILKIVRAGLQTGKKFTGWTVDAEVIDTTAAPDALKATRPGDAAAIMFKQNDSLPGNLKAVEQNLGVERRALLDGSALTGRLVRVTATDALLKNGDPFTFITFTGFAEEGERLSKPASPAPVSEPADDEPPF